MIPLTKPTSNDVKASANNRVGRSPALATPGHEQLSSQRGFGEPVIYRLTSCAAAALLAFGRSAAKWFLRWRDYRRTTIADVIKAEPSAVEHRE
jgi:hypothetical protein